MPKQHVPEWYFESIRKCIIPRIGFGDGNNEPEQKEEEKKEGDNVTITAQTACGGKLSLVFCDYL